MREKEKEIKNWILKNGYPFEMKVASSLKKFDFNVSQSILYVDKNTGKSREIDIIAHSNIEVNNVWFNFAFIIECKKSTDKPWIVFKNEDLFNSQLEERFKPFASRNAKVLLSKTKSVNDKDLELLFPSINYAGYNLVTAFKDKKDLAYLSTVSLLNSCDYLVNQVNDSNLRSCNIYIPLIVIEGELYEANLDKEEEIKLSLVDYSTILNTKAFGDEYSNIVTVVSSKNLLNFINKLKSNCDLFFAKFSKEIIEISNSNPTNWKEFKFN